MKSKKEQKKTNKNKTPKNYIKEGLGPSGVALWATSPDPQTLQKKQKQKTKKHIKKNK